MSSFGKVGLLLLAMLSLNFVAGCSPNDADQMDEEREPHFVQGNNDFNTMNYSAAVEDFEQALEVNPHSAKAHYRLAQLFDTKETNMASAIYHYNEYLRLDPQADNKDLIDQRITNCMVQLASDVLQLPSAPSSLKQVDSLTATNRALQRSVEDLTESLIETNRAYQQEVDQLTRIIQQWKDYSDSQQSRATSYRGTYATAQAGSSGGLPDDTTVSPVPSTSSSGTRRSTTSSGSVTAPSRSHTHIVAAGETMAGIARKAGISTAALEAANPSASPKHLHVGQTLYLPSGN